MKIFLLSVLFLISYINPFAQNQQNPDNWGREVFSLIQVGKRESIVDFLFINAPQLQRILLDDAKAKNSNEDIVKLLEDETYFSQFYAAQKNEFTSRVENVLAGDIKVKWSKAKLDSITYDYIMPIYNGPDEEVFWPSSKSFEIDPSRLSIAYMKLFISRGSRHYILYLKPLALDRSWRIFEGVRLEKRKF